MGILLVPILQYGQIGHPKPKSHPNTVFLQYRWLNSKQITDSRVRVRFSRVRFRVMVSIVTVSETNTET